MKFNNDYCRFQTIKKIKNSEKKNNKRKNEEKKKASRVKPKKNQQIKETS